MYNLIVVIPLITSLISNPNTPFEQSRLHPCGLFCFYPEFLKNKLWRGKRNYKKILLIT